MASGCTSEYIRDINSAAKILRSSDEFAEVNFQYERGFDPITRSRQIYDFSAALHQDANLERAGQLLAESAEKSRRVPDLLIDESTWLMASYGTNSQRTTADLSAEGWSDVLKTARATHAQELEVWNSRATDPKEDDNQETKLALKIHADTYTAGLDEFEQLAKVEAPDEIGEVHVELYAGIEESPWHWETGPVGDHNDSTLFAPIRIGGPLDSNIWEARAVLEAAEQHFGEVYGFFFDNVAEPPRLEITHSGEVETCEDNMAFVPKVEDILGEDVGITLSASSEPDSVGMQIYHEVPDVEADRGATSLGCATGF